MITSGPPAVAQRGSRATSDVEPGEVRIGVQRDVEPVRQGRVDHGQQLAGPTRVDAEVEGGVGQVQRAAGPPGDHDHLRVRRQRAGTVRPVVRRVEAAVLGHHLAQRDELVGVGVHAGWVGQAAAQPDRAVEQTLPDHLGHPRALGGRRGPVVVADHQHPHGPLRHQVRRVAGDPAVQRIQVVGHARPAERELRITVPAGQLPPQQRRRDLVRRGVGESVLAEHLAGDALAHLGEMIMVDQDLDIGVGVQVDEPGRQHPSVRPDHPPGRARPSPPG